MPVLPQMVVVPFGTRGHGWNVWHRPVPMEGMEHRRGLLNAGIHKNCCQVREFLFKKFNIFFKQLILRVFFLF
jgi:hypothetical protein